MKWALECRGARYFLHTWKCTEINAMVKIRQNSVQKKGWKRDNKKTCFFVWHAIENIAFQTFYFSVKSTLQLAKQRFSSVDRNRKFVNALHYYEKVLIRYVARMDNERVV